MILVADSGSTKTDWGLITEKEILHSKTKGINPYFSTSEQVFSSLKNNSFFEKYRNNIQKIYFYGTGCASPGNKNRIENYLNEFFKSAQIFVHTDIFGAARALFKEEAGIACILGSGTNCCHYDGKQITKHTPSLGYILGDEGSGAYLGKILLREYFYLKLPSDLNNELEAKFQITKNKVLERLYTGESPNTYLAGFASFLIDNKNHPYICQLVEKAFKNFVEYHLLYLIDNNEEKIRFTGSIAWYFCDILKTVSSTYDLNINQVIQSPIHGLVQFHQKERV